MNLTNYIASVGIFQIHSGAIEARKFCKSLEEVAEILPFYPGLFLEHM